MKASEASPRAGRGGVAALGAVLLFLLAAKGLPAQPAPAGGGELPIRILSADVMPLTKGAELFHLSGNVRVKKDETLLETDRMSYDRRTDTLTAEGTVRLVDPSFEISCRHLVFRVREDEGTAWGDPRVVQRMQGAEGRKGGWVDLRASQVKFFTLEKRIGAFERVVVEQWDGGERPALAVRIRCRSMEALMENRRSVFKGGVELETPEMGARGERVFYHQLERKIYVVGNASAWNFDPRGAPINVITGNKIVHFLDEKRSVVLGGVTARVYPDEETARRPLSSESDEAEPAGKEGP